MRLLLCDISIAWTIWFATVSGCRMSSYLSPQPHNSLDPVIPCSQPSNQSLPLCTVVRCNIGNLSHNSNSYHKKYHVSDYFPWFNHFATLYRAWQWYFSSVCKISKRLIQQNMFKWEFSLTWVLDQFPIMILQEHPECFQSLQEDEICWETYVYYWLITLRPRQNGRLFADDIFKCILLKENVWIPIKISLKFVPKGLINNIPALVQIMAWRRPGDKPLYEPMMVCLLTHICVTRPQWAKSKEKLDTTSII